MIVFYGVELVVVVVAAVVGVFCGGVYPFPAAGVGKKGNGGK